jgi:PAS domain S-box-containing protein
MQTSIDPKALVQAIGDAVIVCDAQGLVVTWNPAAERMFGFTEAEALGQSMDMIIPERLRKRHWEGYDKTMATGITKYGHDVLRVPAVDKSGRAMSIAFTVAMLHAEDGSVSAVASVIRDETARFGEERALKKRVAELEAQLAAAAAAPAPAAGPAHS